MSLFIVAFTKKFMQLVQDLFSVDNSYYCYNHYAHYYKIHNYLPCFSVDPQHPLPVKANPPGAHVCLTNNPVQSFSWQLLSFSSDLLYDIMCSCSLLHLLHLKLYNGIATPTKKLSRLYQVRRLHRHHLQKKLR